MPQSASLPTYSAIYSFGDSLSDAGNLSITTSAAGATEPVSPPYFQEKYGSISGNVFSNGPTWVQDLSVALGLGTLAPSMAGGTDFAYGGAETGGTPQNASDPAIQGISLPAQLTEFQTGVPKPSANALYTVSIGANDLLDILAQPTLSTTQQTTDVNDAVANEISFVKSLISDGAKTVLVLDVPDLGKTPNVMSGAANGTNTPSATTDALASSLASEYNTALITQLAALTGADIHAVDAYSLIDNAVADPLAYGLTNVTTPVWSGNFTNASSGTLSSTASGIQDQSLFWDSLHPTETGHTAIADTAEQLLSGVAPLSAADVSTGKLLTVNGTPYTGPVASLTQQYINLTTDNLDIAATTPSWFIRSGSGEDAIAVTSGINVLDGGSGSNFLTGGSGADTFFVDAGGAATWSTLVNFHAGDSATLWGVSASDFTLNWVNGAGASGYTGLTLTATASGQPETLVTLAGLTSAALTNGTLSVTSGTDAASGQAYTYIHANG